MRPNLLLHKEFLRHIIKNKNLDNQSDEFEISNTILNYRKCKNIITQAKTVYTNYSKEDIIHLKLIANKVSENNLEAKWINKLMTSNKGTGLKSENYFDENKSSTIKFLGNVNCVNETKEKNIITKGTNYNFEEVFFKSPLRSVFDKKMNSEDHSNTFHHTKNIILIDPYIFSNNFKKKDSLINFLDTCFNFKNNKAEKNFTIVSEFPTKKDIIKNKILQNYLSQLASELNMKTENITLFRHIGTEFGSNRHLITDYALMDLQHAFDRPCVISGLYFYNDNIGRNFKEVNSLLDKIKNSEKKWSETNPEIKEQSLKHNKIKIGNILKNPLFH